MYQWVVYLHVASAFVFLLAHGVSASMVFWLRRESTPERIRPVLDFSASATTITGNASMLLILVTGIIAGIMQEWFSQYWIWTAIGLLILISMGMFFAGTVHYSKVRKAVGLPYMEKGKPQPAVAPANEAEIVALVRGRSPIIVAVLGAVGLTVILWLMMFKPF
jgi:hypothetical protein